MNKKILYIKIADSNALYPAYIWYSGEVFSDLSKMQKYLKNRTKYSVQIFEEEPEDYKTYRHFCVYHCCSLENLTKTIEGCSLYKEILEVHRHTKKIVEAKKLILPLGYKIENVHSNGSVTFFHINWMGIESVPFKLEQLKNSEVEINEAKSGSLDMRGEWRFERKSSHEYLAIRVFTSSVSSEYTKIEKI